MVWLLSVALSPQNSQNRLVQPLESVVVNNPYHPLLLGFTYRFRQWDFCFLQPAPAATKVITRNAVVAACVQQHPLQQALEVIEGAWQGRLATDAAWIKVRRLVFVGMLGREKSARTGGARGVIIRMA